MGGTASLPHGVNRLDLEEAVLIICEDKLVLHPKDGDQHWTLHFGPISKILDIHRTRRAAGGAVEYETLFEISHERLGSLLGEISAELMSAFRSLLHPLQIDWMVRHHVSAEPAFFPPESEFEELTRVRKKRLYIDATKLQDRIGHLAYLEDLLDLPDGRAFSIICHRNPLTPKDFGVGFKVTDPLGRPQLLWCSYRRGERQLKALVGKLMPRFMAAMEITPSE
ncbi:MAG: hypothetical protein HXX12_08325 [Geothrix sp.]|uniref:hypothetical protein n=1 Tax=Geothrix sp. TaxID=1962974 RepID=UPI0018429510|nr:hypothetical protein [Geothrix sp.]NWJ40964.1 hypothetical protein [Geothrix sp.]WIL21038.1 MAG: hypothetical protein QOZ81_000282 [Geothrix sp.]